MVVDNESLQGCLTSIDNLFGQLVTRRLGAGQVQLDGLEVQLGVAATGKVAFVWAGAELELKTVFVIKFRVRETAVTSELSE